MKTLNPAQIAMILLGLVVLTALVLAVVNIATGHYSNHVAI